MARILMTGVPTYGQAYPTFPLTTALVEAGHHVDYLIPEVFRSRVERCGATLLPYADYLHGQAVTRMVEVLGARRIFNDLTAETIRLAGNYDVVVATGLQPQFEAIQSRINRPMARMTAMFWQNDTTLRETLEQVGLPRPLRGLITSKVMGGIAAQTVGRAIFGNGGRNLLENFAPVSRSLNLSVSTAEYQPRVEDFPANCVYMGPSPTMSVPDPTFPMDQVEGHDGPVIYVTLGTVYNGWTGYFRTIARAFADSDALVVMTGGCPGSVDRIGPVAKNIIVRDFVPQAEILRHTDICFTHGGFGSVTDAIMLGATPVVTPLGGDQFFNAARVQALDAGRLLTRFQVGADRVRKIATGILEGSDRPTGTQRLAESFKSAGGPVTGVHAIEALV